MMIATQLRASPLRYFTGAPDAGRERSGQGVAPLLASLCDRVLASRRCMQLAGLAAVALLAAEAWGVSNAIATRAWLSQGTSCELPSCIEMRAPLAFKPNILGNVPARNLISVNGPSAIDGSSAYCWTRHWPRYWT